VSRVLEDEEPAPAPVVPQVAPRTRPSRTYEFQRGSVFNELRVGDSGASLAQSRGTEAPVQGPPLTRSRAAQILREQRTRLTQREAEGLAESPQYTRPIRALASGGEVGQYQLHLVGEKGPELFVPKQAGYVLSHEQTKKVIEEAHHESRRHRKTQPEGVAQFQPDLFGGVGKESSEG